MIPVRMLLFVMFTVWLGRGGNVGGSNVNGSNDHDLVKYLYGETDIDDEIEIYDLPDDDDPNYLEKCY